MKDRGYRSWSSAIKPYRPPCLEVRGAHNQAVFVYGSSCRGSTLVPERQAPHTDEGMGTYLNSLLLLAFSLLSVNGELTIGVDTIDTGIDHQ